MKEYDGITLILACRSVPRGEKARQLLLQKLDEEVEKLKEDKDGYDGHAEVFAKGVQLVVRRVDLAEVKSVFAFVEELKST